MTVQQLQIINWLFVIGSWVIVAVGLGYVGWQLWGLYRDWPHALKPMTQEDREVLANRDQGVEGQDYYEFGSDRFPLDDI